MDLDQAPAIGALSRPFLFFVGRVRDPTEIDYRKKSWYPYSNLSTGGPSLSIALVLATLRLVLLALPVGWPVLSLVLPRLNLLNCQDLL